MTRLFVSIDIDEIIKESIGSIYNKIDTNIMKARFTPIQNLHLTLKFIGERTDDDIDNIIDIISGVCEKSHSFDVEYRGCGVFPNLKAPRILWVGSHSEQLPLTASLLDKKLATIGIKSEKRKFKSHITVARIKEMYDSDKLGDIIGSLKNYNFGTQRVNKIYLKKSVLTPKGPIYSTLGEAELK